MVVLRLDNLTLLLGILGSSMVYGAVVMKNSSEQMGMPSDNMMAQIGKSVFAAGWLIIAYVISDKKMSVSSGVSLAAALGVMVAVFNMKAIMEEKKMMEMEMAQMEEEQKEEFKQLRIPGLPMPVFAAMFALSWLVVGAMVGMGRGVLSKVLGGSAVALVLSSMMMILPMQRAGCIVDGPGVGMFALAWVLITIGSSLE